jgi:hypothetical protein
MKRLLIKAGLWALLVLTAAFFCNRSCTMQERAERAQSNLRAYEEQMSSDSCRMRQLELTQAEMAASRDSVVRKMDSIREVLKIRERDLQRVEYVRSKVYVHDTVTLTDTVFCMAYDTVYEHNPMTKLRLKFTPPDTMVIETDITSSLYVTCSLKKEYVHKRSKVFFIRWFQKKRKVAHIDVIEENPAIRREQTRFVEVVQD